MPTRLRTPNRNLGDLVDLTVPGIPSPNPNATQPTPLQNWLSQIMTGQPATQPAVATLPSGAPPSAADLYMGQANWTGGRLGLNQPLPSSILPPLLQAKPTWMNSGDLFIRNDGTASLRKKTTSGCGSHRTED